jgi:hypothetical protein
VGRSSLQAKAEVCEIAGMVRRRSPGGEQECWSSVSPERHEVLRKPASWPSGWAGFEKPWGDVGHPDIAAETAASFDDEPRREVAPGHPLYERRCIAIAKREATDDVLFALGAEEMAVVHLTWGQKPEPPPWPSTTFYASFDEFLTAVPEDFGD